MANSAVTISENRSHGPLIRVKFAWTSDDAAGTVTSATTGNLTEQKYTGFIVGCTTVPSATAPTALYDITILDDEGLDVLCGQGADRSATVTEYAPQSSLGVVVDSKLYLTVANAGNSKLGTVYLYIVPSLKQ